MCGREVSSGYATCTRIMSSAKRAEELRTEEDGEQRAALKASVWPAAGWRLELHAACDWFQWSVCQLKRRDGAATADWMDRL